MLTDADYHNLFKFGVALTGNEDDSFELLQQAIENYIRARSQSQSQSQSGQHIDKPLAYIRRSLKNLYIDRLRHEQKFRHIDYDDCEQEPILISEPHSLEELLITKQEFGFCWAQMTVHERELLYLTAIAGFTVQEIADELNVSKGTLLSKLHRLKARLRAHLKQIENETKVV